MKKSKDTAAGSFPQALPPFVAACRAELVAGVGGYSRCLVDPNIACGYRSSPFTLDRFCLHPRHQEIAAHTAGTWYKTEAGRCMQEVPFFIAVRRDAGRLHPVKKKEAG
jgi:hypothetical protein